MIYKNLILDEERALYAVKDASVIECKFTGPADGESALKECRNIKVIDCDFELRYPFWHVEGAEVSNCRLTDTCRAAFWYDKDVTAVDCAFNGIKAMRECDNTTLISCTGESPEFGWYCRGLTAKDCSIVSEYVFLNSEDLNLHKFSLKGKYSFQYVKNAVITDSYLDTKDAFWHTKNVTVIDSVIKGEYLAWYSENLKLIRCKIIGTQPLCYAKGLVLEDCEMIDCDLSFENSEVNAVLKGFVHSVKNPIHGSIKADHIGEIILDENLPEDADCTISVNEV